MSAVAFGECECTQHLDRDTGEYVVTVDRADPRVLVGDELLAVLASPQPVGNFPAWERNASLTCRGGIICCGDCAQRNDWAGAILRIYGTNRTVVYRIIGKHHNRTWIAEWPD